MSATGVRAKHVSAIGEELSNEERNWLFSGKCPECGSTDLKEGFPHGVGAVVNGLFETDIQCNKCPFSCHMTRKYAEKKEAKAR